MLRIRITFPEPPQREGVLVLERPVRGYDDIPSLNIQSSAIFKVCLLKTQERRVTSSERVWPRTSCLLPLHVLWLALNDHGLYGHGVLLFYDRRIRGVWRLPCGVLRHVHGVLTLFGDAAGMCCFLLFHVLLSPFVSFAAPELKIKVGEIPELFRLSSSDGGSRNRYIQILKSPTVRDYASGYSFT